MKINFWDNLNTHFYLSALMSLLNSRAAQTTKVLPQVGTSFKIRDRPRKALAPGKRISRNGNVYWETRTNRSDGWDSDI